MHADRWSRIENLCHAALERPEEQQAAFLEAACAGDAGLRREVESLLAHQKRAEHFIESPAVDFAAKAITGDELCGASEVSPLAGRIISHYRIEERLAAGGMGEVYRAARADGSYEKKVAIKFIRSGLGSGFFLTRFRNERQILASLDHPNIARLLDGGTTEDGLPYVVMEYIGGLPIDAYCLCHSLTIPQRLNLFRTVCTAVQFAHQNLVIHRDLKPGNILVTEEGIPKLLDFGIAKILKPQAGELPADLTVTMLPLMTPDFASPEQVRNKAITTSTDIYSLGVILYLLLTGRRPYRASSDSPHDLMKAICETDPEKPSTAVTRPPDEEDRRNKQLRETQEASPRLEERPEKLRRTLSGDLDNIVLMALRKEPARRYSSVEQFSEDIRRHLVGLPVLAHTDTLGYRAGKFIGRHKLAVGAAVLLVLSLVGGMLATLRQARIAQFQRARAERRFNDVRNLANSLLTDIHDGIANLPGTVAVRKTIVSTSLNYLDSLASEASGDPSLQRELSGAYGRVADIQGRPGTENLGDTKGALASYQKAAQITQALLHANPRSEEDKKDLGALYIRIGHALTATGDYSSALKYDRMALAIYTEMTRDFPSEKHYQTLLGIAYLNLGQHQDFTGELQASLDNLGKAEQIYEDFAKSTDKSAPRSALYNVGLSNLWMGVTWLDAGNYSKALECSKKSLQIRKQILERNPKNVRAQLDLADSFFLLGETLRKQEDFAGAAANHRQGLDIALAAAANDPNDQRAKADSASAYYGLGESLRQQGDFAKALDLGGYAVKLGGELSAADPANMESRLQLAKALCLLGEAYEDRGLKDTQRKQTVDLKEALTSYRKGLEIYKSLRQAGALPYSETAEMDRVEREIARCAAALA